VTVLAIYLLVGVVAGVLAGLFGIGGGLIIVPALNLTFRLQGVGDENLMHLALGTSLATIFGTALSSVLAHHRRGAIQWKVARRLMPGIVIGTLIGAMAAHQIPSPFLQRGFGLFEIAIALQMLLAKGTKPHRNLPGNLVMTTAGGSIGFMSALAGIGGGTLTVPFLVWHSLAMRHAVAISSACGLPIAIAGTLGYLWAGWHQPDLPEFSTGYVYWPAVLGISVTTLAFAPLGARLAHQLAEQRARRLFALLMASIGLNMLII
jgi:uncharacterized membrane protein YfcA